MIATPTPRRTRRPISGSSSDLSISEIQDRLVWIAKRSDLYWANAGDYARLGIVEGIAHELAHLVDLDMDPRFESSLDAMSDAEANDREVAALRIEVAALAALGVRVSMRRLWATANWRGGAGMPPLVRLRSPLTQREQRLADQIVSMVISTTTAEDEQA